MATRTIFVDDLDGSEDDVETVQFSLDGVGYAIDLGAGNQDALRDALQPYIDSARREGRAPAKAVRRHATPAKVQEIPASVGARREQIQAIRDWARSQGMGVSDRGRVSANVVDAFNQAHGIAS